MPEVTSSRSQTEPMASSRGSRSEGSRSWLQRSTYDLSRWAARLVAVPAFHVRCHGRTRLPIAGGGLVCANHQSFLDPVLVGLACDRRLNYLARRTLFDHRWFGRLIRWYDAIPLERDGLGIAGLKETLRRLRRGELVLLFPEGTRTVDGHVGPLKPGFCALARRGDVPLIPVGIVGAYDAWPRTSRWPRLATIHLQFGPPIEPAEIAQMTDEELVATLSQRLQACVASSR